MTCCLVSPCILSMTVPFVCHQVRCLSLLLFTTKSSLLIHHVMCCSFASGWQCVSLDCVCSPRLSEGYSRQPSYALTPFSNKQTISPCYGLHLLFGRHDCGVHEYVVSVSVLSISVATKHLRVPRLMYPRYFCVYIYLPTNMYIFLYIYMCATCVCSMTSC